MKKRINTKLIQVYIFLLCAMLANISLVKAQQTESMNILFIGNSFTARHDLNLLVEELIKEGKPNINIYTDKVIYGGQSLFQHTEYYYSHTFIEQSTITNTEIQNRIDEMTILLGITDLPAEYIHFWQDIRQQPVRDFPYQNIEWAINRHQNLLNNNPRTKWDYVVLQSWDDEYPDLNDGYAKYAKYLGEIARNQGAKVIFYNTAPDFQNYAPVTEPQQQADFDQQFGLIMDLTQQFQPYAVVPVSMAINSIQQGGTDLTFRYVNDFHPNQRTAFLTANMIYDAIFKESTEGFAFNTVTETKTTEDTLNPGNLLDPDGNPATVVFEESEKLYLQQVAFQTVSDFENIWKGTAVTGVSIIDPSKNGLYVGYSYQMQYNLEPPFASDKRVWWNLLSGDAVMLDTNGLLTAVSEGDATIGIKTYDGGFTDTLHVTITKEIFSVDGISLEGCSYDLQEPGDTFRLTATVTPSYATDKSVRWSSSNPNVTTVDSTGLVTSHSMGNAYIRATTNDIGFYEECLVFVNESDTPDTTDVTVFTTVNKMRPVKLYPNPVQDKIYLKFPDSGTQKKVLVYNSVGQKLFATSSYQSQIEIDVSHLTHNKVLIVGVINGETVEYFKVATRF